MRPSRHLSGGGWYAEYHDSCMTKRREQPIEPQSDDFDWLFSIAPFRIPRYQRAYDWDTEEVRDYARDVAGLVRLRLDGGRGRHFFGALISIFHKSEHFYEVVDGQQRLATQMICLNELYDHLDVLAEQTKVSGDSATEKKARARSRYVRKKLEDENGPRLRLSKRDAQFFGDLLDGVAGKPGAGADQSHRRLWDARSTIRAELFEVLTQRAAPAERMAVLEVIEKALLEDGYLVHLYTEQRGDAYRLFSVLNDRGRPLSDGALLRTHTLAVLEKFPTQQEAAEADWDAILKIGDSFVNRFLAAYYVSYVGSRPPTGELFDRFRDRFLVNAVKSSQAATALRKKVARLREETETFSRVLAGDWPFDDPKVGGWDRDRLKRLVVALRHDLSHPLLLAVARETNESSLRDLVQMLEPFVFRYINVTGGNPARLASVYYEQAKKVRTNRRLDKNGLRNILRGMIKNHAPDEVFVPLLREQLRYARNAARRKLIKHFLTTLEDYEEWFVKGATGKPKVKAKAAVYDLDQVNIEHIYPQRPKQPNVKLDELKDALGNLTALDDRDGQVASNESFSKKRAIYEKSLFQITQPLGKMNKWDAAAVSKRFTFYSERATKIFVVS